MTTHQIKWLEQLLKGDTRISFVDIRRTNELD